MSSIISLGVQNIKIMFESTTKRVQLQKDYDSQLFTILKSFDLLNSKLNYKLAYDHLGFQKAISNNSEFQSYVQLINQKQQVKLILLKSDLKLDLISEREVDLKATQKLNETIVIERDQKENFGRNDEYNKVDSKLSTIIQTQLKSLELGLYDQLHTSNVFKSIANSSPDMTKSDIFRTKNPKARRVEITCSICKFKSQHPFIFYCNSPQCFDLIICPYCEERHSNEDESEHILIKSYKALTLKPKLEDVVTESILLSPKKEANSKNYERPMIVKNQFNKDANHITNKYLDSTYLELKQSYVIKEGKDIDVIIRTQNTGTAEWPIGSKFANIHVKDNNNIVGEDSSLKKKFKPNENVNFIIKLQTSNKPKGKYTSLWQLQNEKGEPFGQVITIHIEIV